MYEYQNVVVNSDPHLSSANVCYSKISKVVQIRLNRALRRHLSSSQFEEIAGQPFAPPSLPPRRPSAAPDARKKWAVPAFPALYRHFGADRGAGERALLPAAAMSSLFCSRHAFRKIKISESGS